MTRISRVALRLRRRALRCYEMTLYVVLLAMALAVAPAFSGEEEPETLQCGKTQSSSVVIVR